MKCTSLLLLIFAVTLSTLEARIWRDTEGRTMKADIVSATENDVTVLMNGEEFTIPLSKLSKADQNYVEDWLADQAGGKVADAEDTDNGGNKPKPGELTFDGQPLISGGKVNKYHYDYDPEQLETVQRKLDAEDTGYRIAIAVPHNFDPSKPQKVFIPRTAVNNAKQGKAGNFGVVNFYAKKCVQNGWVCITYDTNLGQNGHDADLYAAMKKLNEVWPQIKNWEFAVGGFSGGAKACWGTAAYLLKNDYKVIGAMLSGCNQDLSAHFRKKYRAPRSAYSDIKVHLSNAKWDKVANPDKQDDMEKSLNKNGMRKIKKTIHEGKHNLEIDQIDIALPWFSAKDEN